MGRGGDVGLYREEVLCVILPTREGFEIYPRASRILYDDGEGQTVRRDRPFTGVLETHYRVEDGDGIEFWLERVENAPSDGGKNT